MFYPLKTCLAYSGFFMVDKQKYIQRVQDHYETTTGNKISASEALDIFENLTTLVSAIYKPIPK